MIFWKLVVTVMGLTFAFDHFPSRAACNAKVPEAVSQLKANHVERSATVECLPDR